MIKFLCQIKTFLMNTLRMFKIEGFSRFFCLNCPIPCFSRFPGRVATLICSIFHALLKNEFFLEVYEQSLRYVCHFINLMLEVCDIYGFFEYCET